LIAANVNNALGNSILDDSVISRQRQLQFEDRGGRKQFAEMLKSDVSTMEDGESSFSGLINVLVVTNDDEMSSRTEKILKESSTLNVDNVYALSAGMSTLRKLARSDGVASIEIDHVVSIIDDMPDDHDEARRGRGLQEMEPQGVNEVLQDPSFWDTLTPQGPIKICVVDSGYNLGHPDLPTEPDVTGFNNPYVPDEKWSFDGNGHGTHVAGKIAALGGNEKGIRGVIQNNKNGKFQLMIGKAFDQNGIGYESSVLNAINDCKENGANIISLSLGSGSYTSASAIFYQSLYDQGILVISAAGNGYNDDFSYPASYSSVMSVASVRSKLNMKKSSFSQYNSQVEISAPGEDVYSTWKNHGYMHARGTSMATPHVAGIAGLLWMQFPTCTNQQIRNVLDATTSTTDSHCNKNTGYGFVQGKNAYNLLFQGNCGGFLSSAPGNGGCEQLQTHSIACSTVSDCDDNDPCTVDICQSSGMCTFETDCSLCGKASKLTVEVKPDNYPDEINWSLKKGSSIIMSGGPYPESKPYTKNLCVDAGTYTFAITDSYGDGLCCQDGNGYYSLKLDGKLEKESIRTSDTSWAYQSTSINVVTSSPADTPTNSPSNLPSGAPTSAPINSPSNLPSGAPTSAPINSPSNLPSGAPTSAPINSPKKCVAEKKRCESNGKRVELSCCDGYDCFRGKCIKDNVCMAKDKICVDWKKGIRITKECCPGFECKWKCQESKPICVNQNKECVTRKKGIVTKRECCDGLECWRKKCVKKDVCVAENKHCVWWFNGKTEKACCGGLTCKKGRCRK